MIYDSVQTNIRIYLNIFLQILIFIFDTWKFWKPNIVRKFKYLVRILPKSARIKEVLFSFLTWKDKEVFFKHFSKTFQQKAKLWLFNFGLIIVEILAFSQNINVLIFQQILHFCITNYSKIFEYLNILYYSTIICIYQAQCSSFLPSFHVTQKLSIKSYAKHSLERRAC